jgi:NADH-quinone oxidoreductase subunit G
VIDLCPVGALLSRRFLHQARVWYLQSTPSVCPGCERGCSVDLWHRKAEWQLHKVDPGRNTRIERVTPRENPAVNGPWICNKGRDLADVFGRARATQPMLHGEAVGLPHALVRARALIAHARRPVALVSSWGSNEELAAFARVFGARFACFVKRDCEAEPGETVEDALLIKPDKNPNRAGALVHFAPLPANAQAAFPSGTDLVLAWGQGVDLAGLPAGARLVVLGAWPQAANERADVFLPISVQTERAGHYTNFAGVVSAFAACFAKPPGVSDAAVLFELIGAVATAEATP